MQGGRKHALHPGLPLSQVPTEPEQRGLVSRNIAVDRAIERLVSVLVFLFVLGTRTRVLKSHRRARVPEGDSGVRERPVVK